MSSPLGWHDIERSETAMTLESIASGSGIGLAVDCSDCGGVIRIGSWPFCRSQANPQGHETGCYGWHFGGS